MATVGKLVLGMMGRLRPEPATGKGASTIALPTVEPRGGDFLTKVFEGPYSDARQWCAEMERHVTAEGRQLDTLYLFYTTRPRCAKHYGKNYVVGVAKVR